MAFPKKSSGKKPPFGGKSAGKKPPFGGKSAAKPGVPAAAPKPKKTGPQMSGKNTPIKKSFSSSEEVSAAKGEKKDAKAQAAPVSKSTALGGKANAATPEPKLSPEAEAARAQQGAVTVLKATGPAVAPPPDPRTSYQVGDPEDNTPLVSFTALASAASKKGQPSALLEDEANSDLEEDGEAEDDEEDSDEEMSDETDDISKLEDEEEEE